MKVKIKQKQISKFLIGLIIVASIIFIAILISSKTKPSYSVKTPDGTVYSFRENVKTASKIHVYPDEKTLRETFLNSNLTDITFVFIPSDSKTNGYYTVWAVEFGYKLTQFYNSIGYVNGEANIAAQAVDSLENVSSESMNLKLVVVPFNQATENKVMVDQNRIYLYGRTPKEMDYVVIKTILTVLGNWSLA